MAFLHRFCITGRIKNIPKPGRAIERGDFLSLFRRTDGYQYHTGSTSLTSRVGSPKKEIDWKEAKTKFFKMDPNEKRSYYKNKDRLLTIDEIRPWPSYFNKRNLKLYKGEKKWSVSHPINNRVSVGQGDLTTLEIDAVVTSATTDLIGAGGSADKAIHEAAGPELKAECQSLRGCDVGQAKITGGYRLPANYVIHTVGPKGEIPAKLSACYVSVLKLMEIEKLKTVAFPCISTESSGYPSEKAVHVALHTVRKFLHYNPDRVERVIFCIYQQKDLEVYESAMQIYFPME